MGRPPALARRFYERFEPVHAVTYFAPEARSAFDGLGYRGFWMGYFAARSAPLGEVAPEVVTAIFHNFSPARVAKALPAAWEVAGPAAALQARAESAAAALRRCGVTDDEAATAARLARKAAQRAPIDGRPLFAANRALPWPEDPVAGLWHATTLLREHRGDGHVAALTAAGVSGREANVLHAAAGRVGRDYLTRSRDYDEQEWCANEASLRDRGLLDADGALTARGSRVKDDIESTTDALALSALAGLDDGEVEELFAALTPVTRKAVGGGDIPAVTPMALRGDDLHDASARLS